MIKLPEAAFKQGAVTVQIGDTFSTVETKTVISIVVINLYTEKQLKKAVRDALEEAAKRIAGYDDFPVYEMLANEIRQLKEGL